MTIADDAQKLLDHCDGVGLDLTNAEERGWDHMGAVIVDSALQRRQKYKATVLPRARKVVAEWPEATTTSLFARRIESEDLEEFLPWHGEERITQIHDTVRVLQAHGIETTGDFAQKLQDAGPAGADLRRDLLGIHGVGPATMDYFSILVGLDWRKFDMHLIQFARDAGITNLSHDSLSDVFAAAAQKRAGTTIGALDAAIWEHESSKK